MFRLKLKAIISPIKLHAEKIAMRKVLRSEVTIHRDSDTKMLKIRHVAA
jgi:hypothetical protein